MKKICQYHIAFYDGDGCYDEALFESPNDLEWLLNFMAQTACDRQSGEHGEYIRVFVYDQDGSKYELKLERSSS
jgi:hypothetical protein